MSARLLHIFIGQGGGTPTFKSEAFASFATLSLNFAPEPGRLALLATGLLGLLVLARVSGPGRA